MVMKHQDCLCHPRVEGARFRAYLLRRNGAGGVYSPGVTYGDAVANVKKHAIKDGIPKKDWGEIAVENLDGMCDACGRVHPSVYVIDELKQARCHTCR